jgi:hypothetical protein
MRNVKLSVLLAAGAAGLVLSTAACAGGGSGTEAPSPAPTGPSAAGSSGSHSGGNGGGQGAGRTPSGTPASPARTRCLTRDLQISDRTGTNVSATRHTEDLVFRNTSDRTCYLEGYPGVSFVAGNSGTQVGSAFHRTSGEEPWVRLTPGGQAHATITVTYAPNACSPVQARGYRVYPPNETAAVFVSRPQYACTATGQSVGDVQPIRPGATDN